MQIKKLWALLKVGSSSTAPSLTKVFIYFVIVMTYMKCLCSAFVSTIALLMHEYLQLKWNLIVWNSMCCFCGSMLGKINLKSDTKVLGSNSARYTCESIERFLLHNHKLTDSFFIKRSLAPMGLVKKRQEDPLKIISAWKKWAQKYSIFTWVNGASCVPKIRRIAFDQKITSPHGIRKETGRPWTS